MNNAFEGKNKEKEKEKRMEAILKEAASLDPILEESNNDQ